MRGVPTACALTACAPTASGPGCSPTAYGLEGGRLRGMRVLVVDNFDSFTFNLVDYLARLGADVTVTPNTRPVPLGGFDAIVLSPGPGTPARPADIGFCASVLDKATVPVLGVCLGFQAMAHRLGADIVHAPEPVHGLVDAVTCEDDPLFCGIPARHEVVRYHSLVVDKLPANMRLLARTDDGLIMAARAVDRPWWGVQYHPESVCSEHGLRLMENFLALACSSLSDGYALEPRPAKPQLPALVCEERALGIDPVTAFEALGRKGALLEFEGTAIIAALPNDPTWVSDLAELDAAPTHRRPADCLASPGFYGYLGYEALADATSAPMHAPDTPAQRLFFAPRVVALRDGRVQLVSCKPEPAWAAAAWDALEHATPREHTFDPATIGALSCRDTATSYAGKIARAQELIREGETYEVCLTTALGAEDLGVDPVATYAALRSSIPAPMRSLLVLPEASVISVSPERFLKVESGVVTSEPIKGTRPRGHDAAADEELRRDLATNLKDRAENLMIVDLVRNDLTRVGVPGTIEVDPLFEVRSFTTVHQLVSTVRARLADGVTCTDLLKATFPGGSMTGAPKLRTMGIISSLEGTARGVYSGCIGFVGCDGDLDLAMTIRTLVVSGGRVSYGIGGAIVALSDPAAEWLEIIAKSAPFLRLSGQPFPGAQAFRFTGGALVPQAAVPDPLVIDSFLLVDGYVRALDRHEARFRAGCLAMGLGDPDDFLTAVPAALPRTGAWFPRLEASPESFALRLRPAPARRSSTRLGVTRATLAYPRVKGPNLQLLSTLKQPGCDDVLLVGEDGCVTEAATAALVMWDGDTLVSVDASRLDSVTESVLLDAARGRGVAVDKRKLHLEDLRGHEVWTLNALHGITPVTDIGRQPLPPADPARLSLWRGVLEGVAAAVS